jgi:hypothetical protein
MIHGLISLLPKFTAFRAKYTTAVAAKLDYLNRSVASLAPASTALDSSVWTDAMADKLLNLGSHFAGNPVELAGAWVRTAFLSVPKSTPTGTDDAVTFWNYINTVGSYTSVTADDAYPATPICDLSNSNGGFLYQVISPCNSGSRVITLKITIDGTVYTVSATSDANSNRLVLGLLGNIEGISQNAKLGKYEYHVDAAVPLLSPVRAHLESSSILRFNSTLKVEAKISVRAATTYADRCGAVYRLNP